MQETVPSSDEPKVSNPSDPNNSHDLKTLPAELAAQKKIPVSEIFGPTIQGEGAMIGVPTVFVRFAGCDFRCGRCDSLFAVLPELWAGKAARYTNEELAHTIDLYMKQHAPRVTWITFSGGNPVMWDLTVAIGLLQELGYKICIETQASLWRDWILDVNFVTMSPKPPGMEATFDSKDMDLFYNRLVANPSRKLYKLPTPWCIKVVIFSMVDIEWYATVLRRWPRLRADAFISFGNYEPPKPAKRQSEELTYEELIQGNLANGRIIVEEALQHPGMRDVKILPQLHVLLWGNKQGV